MSGRPVRLLDLLDHQRPIADSPARFKVLREGRRWGKDVIALHVAVVGHGPTGPDGEPRWKGLMQGFDVVWAAPTIPQTNALWLNEVEPRFRRKHGVKVNTSTKTVSLENPDGSPFATLWVRSAEAIDSVRGGGGRLGGVVINEAAHMDLEGCWRDVLRPMLMDHGGWAVIQSTTNAGPDGFENEAGKRTPSYFNLLCQEILDGQRGPEWAEWHGDARENPRIKPEEFAALVAEYPPEDPRLAQEVYAKLIKGYGGLAFPEWRDDVHTTTWSPARGDPDWSWVGGMDWGYAKPACFLLAACGPSQTVLFRREWYFSGKPPKKAGYELGQLLKGWGHPWPEYIACDLAMFGVGQDGRSIASRVQAGLDAAFTGKAGGEPTVLIPLIPAPKGPGSRKTRKLLLHEYLRYGPPDKDGKIPPWLQPKVRFHTDCKASIRTIPQLSRDPKDLEDVDTLAEDHAYDAATMLLLTYLPENEREPVKVKDENVHPGLDAKGHRRKPPPWQVALVGDGREPVEHHRWRRSGDEE